MYQMLLLSLVLLVGESQRPGSQPTGPGDVLPPLVGAHVPQDLLGPTALPLLIEELRQFRSLAAAFSAEPRDPDMISRERLDRGVLAMRAAAAGRVLECRVALLEIVAACEHPSTELYVLDALAALRTLGEPEEYFMDLVARAPSSAHRGAAAMLVLGWTPNDDLVERLRIATLACPSMEGTFRPYATMQSSLAQVQRVNELRRRVEDLLAKGDRTSADKRLLRPFAGLYYEQRPGAPPAYASTFNDPSANYARILLWQRAAEDPAGLRASIEAMTLYDFLGTEDDGFNHLDPDKRLATFREQVLSLLPESVRQARLAESSGD